MPRLGILPALVATVLLAAACVAHPHGNGKESSGSASPTSSPAAVPPAGATPDAETAASDPAAPPSSSPAAAASAGDGTPAAALPSAPVASNEPEGPAPAAARPGGACPSGMILIDGQYCPTVRHHCKHWIEEESRFGVARCQEYEPTAECLEPREHRRFCVDREEHTPEGKDLPSNDMSWTKAGQVCKSQGKRLCTESEWTFACEGEAMLPYPYGWQRDPTACNFDKSDLVAPDGGMRDLREPTAALPRCLSPWGVHNMVGNVDEWVVQEKVIWPHRSGLKGGWWLAGRNRCRAITVGHDEYYFDTQTGFRCCATAAE